jgi:hypothetical protein
MFFILRPNFPTSVTIFLCLGLCGRKQLLSVCKVFGWAIKLVQVSTPLLTILGLHKQAQQSLAILEKHYVLPINAW